jgi:16S rRNA processing protein RimM
MADEHAPRLTVGYVAGAHGVRGTVRIQLFDRNSDALEPGAELVLIERDTKKVVHRKTIASMAMVPGKPAARVDFEGVQGREAADALKGLTVEVERGGLPDLSDDEFYLADAIGLKVERTLDDGVAQPLGKIVAVTTNGAQDLFEIEYFDEGGRAQRWLIPVLPGFVKDVDAKRVLVDPPQGMLPEALERE